MKRILVVLVVLACVLFLGSCNLFYGIFPGADPIVGTWKCTQTTFPAGNWQTAAAAGVSLTLTVKDDYSWSETVSGLGGGPAALEGTWTDTSAGIYTFICTTASYASADVVTLSSDQKTLYSQGGGISFQLTKN